MSQIYDNIIDFKKNAGDTSSSAFLARSAAIDWSLKPVRRCSGRVGLDDASMKPPAVIYQMQTDSSSK
jgi:hypothetical protein